MSALENIGTFIALDVAFALATGFTGVHGLIVDWGAGLGDALGIEPWFDAHAGHDHGGGGLGESFESAHDHSDHAANDDVHGGEIFSDKDPDGFKECFEAGGTVHPHENAMACMLKAA